MPTITKIQAITNRREILQSNAFKEEVWKVFEEFLKHTKGESIHGLRKFGQSYSENGYTYFRNQDFQNFLTNGPFKSKTKLKYNEVTAKWLGGLWKDYGGKNIVAMSDKQVTSMTKILTPSFGLKTRDMC